MKKVYQTNAAGVYVGTTTADESPLEPGVYLIPAGCVETPPPECAVGMAALLQGKIWATVPDWRGIPLYRTQDGTLTSIDAVGIVPADINATPSPPRTMDDVWQAANNDWVIDPEKRIARLTAEAMLTRDRLLAIASMRMAPLQDAVDIKDANAAEKSALLKWKQYRIDVNRIAQQSGFPDQLVWPDAPDA